MNFRDFMDQEYKIADVLWDGYIETYGLRSNKKWWNNQDFSPFIVNESFSSDVKIKVLIKQPKRFVTEFHVGDTQYTFKCEIDKDSIDASFYADGDFSITNLQSGKYLGLLGSGIFRSLDKLFREYDSVNWEEFSFNTTKLVENIEGETIVNPLIEFYDSNYLQRVLSMKYHLILPPNRLESSNYVMWTFKFDK